MKITTSFDVGDMVPVNDIKISITLETTPAEAWAIPDIRETIADNLDALLKNLQMNERGRVRERERILLSGKLTQELRYPYNYVCRNHYIQDMKNKKDYSVKDYLEGRLPGLSIKR